MSTKTLLKILLFINIILALSGVEIEYKEHTINSMKTSMFKSKKENIYNLGSLISKSTIIAFSDLDNNKYTDIISYNRTNPTSPEFNFYVHYYDKKGKEFEKAVSLFSITIEDDDMALGDITVRNLHVFSFHYDKKNDKKYSFLITFNTGTDKLLHYVKTQDDDFEPYKLDIYSNILMLNRNANKNVRFLYHDGKKRTICQLMRKKEEKKYVCDDDTNVYFDQNINKTISLNGGMAYVDLNGDCIPDIILSREDDGKRYIEVYIAKNETKYILNSDFEVGEADKFGALAVTRINDNKSSKKIPFLDILVPNLDANSVYHYENKGTAYNKWSNYYCKENKGGFKGELFNSTHTECPLEIDDNGNNVELDHSFPTVIRTGDFLAKSNPGLLVRHNILKEGKINDTQISLFERKEKDDKYQYVFYKGIKMSEIKEKKEKNNDDVSNDEQFNMGLFFDINESGTLSFIIPTNKDRNYFFFNYKRNFYFVKSKLMNDKDKFYDTNLGASYRYVVTDKKGDRHQDISYQLMQTSDTNIPMPYSIMGLDDTNNYVEYFQTISGNVLKDVKWEKSGEKNYIGNSPIIPNTQMMISKYYSGSKIKWNVDLIVQPMEQIWIFLIIVVLVLLIVLCIIIYLHLKEVKEEQKETNKFKSWFA